MGFWSSVGSIVSSVVDTVSDWIGGSSCSSGDGGSSSSSSSHNSSVQTLYEPDRVKIAELELQLAETNSENARMLLEEQKELIKLNAQMQGAIIEAEAKSFEHSAEVLKNLMKDVNLIAQQRLALLESGQLEAVQQIETLYSNFEKEVQKDNMSFQLNQLPQMMEILTKFEPDSSSHKLYSDSIQKQIDLNLEFVSQKFADLSKRQNMLVESVKDTKESILQHSNRIVEDRMKFLEQQLESRKELASINSQNLKELSNQNSIPTSTKQIEN